LFESYNQVWHFKIRRKPAKLACRLPGRVRLLKQVPHGFPSQLEWQRDSNQTLVNPMVVEAVSTVANVTFGHGQQKTSLNSIRVAAGTHLADDYQNRCTSSNGQ